MNCLYCCNSQDSQKSQQKPTMKEPQSDNYSAQQYLDVEKVSFLTGLTESHESNQNAPQNADTHQNNHFNNDNASIHLSQGSHLSNLSISKSNLDTDDLVKYLFDDQPQPKSDYTQYKKEYPQNTQNGGDFKQLIRLKFKVNNRMHGLYAYKIKHGDNFDEERQKFEELKKRAGEKSGHKSGSMKYVALRGDAGKYDICYFLLY